MAKHTNTESVMKQIDLMDQMDGTDYDPQIETNDDNADENDDDDNSGSVLQDDAGQENQEDDPTPKAKTVEADETNKPVAKQANEEVKPVEGEVRKSGNNFVDSKNNIVDPRTGQIIAKAGTERRLFEKAQRLNSRLEESSARLTHYEKQETDAGTFFGMAKQANLSMNDIGEAFNIAILFKSDPVAAAKKVLENVLALGHNVTDILGADAGNAVEMPAIARMIDERLAPIIKPLQQQSAQTELTQKAERALNQFIDDHEYADVHLADMDRLIGLNEGMSPQKAYNSLLLFANKHGLDFSQPLGPQIKQASARTDNNPPERRERKPFPNGSSAEPRSLGEKDYADSGSSWADIIGSVLPRNR